MEISPYTLEQIRYWMRQNFGFAREVPIVVKEVPCVKPTCPPIETAIMAILRNEPPRHFKIQRPINEITFDNVYLDGEIARDRETCWRAPLPPDVQAQAMADGLALEELDGHRAVA